MANELFWLNAPLMVAASTMAVEAYAVQYLTVEQAQQILFPGANRFSAARVKLSPEQKRGIEQAAKVRVRTDELIAWRVETGNQFSGWFLLDEVYGKHEFISYALALDTTGAVRGIEILDYRETHGGEVRNPKWRAQFLGKKAGAPLALDEDIKNISGATLSCKHVTEGVRRLLASYELVLK